MGQPSYLDFYVAHFSRGADDGPAHQRREDVRREVRPGIAALHKLVEREDEKTHSLTVSTNSVSKMDSSFPRG